MKPEHQERRKIIREWMALPQDKRRTEAQIEAFARKAMGRIAFRPDPYRQIVSWVRPRRQAMKRRKLAWWPRPVT
jgi:hypothetical protein